MRASIVKRLTFLATALSATVLLSGCTTSAGRPTKCEVGTKKSDCKVVKKAHNNAIAGHSGRSSNY